MHPARREPLGIETEIADDVAGQTNGVSLVVDRERARVAQHLTVASQDPDARRVERRYPHALDHRSDQRPDPLAHLGGGLVGERDRQDFGRSRALVDQMCDAVGEHPGLARPGACHDEQRPVGMHHGIELIGVETKRERARQTPSRVDRTVVELDLGSRVLGGVGGVGSIAGRVEARRRTVGRRFVELVVGEERGRIRHRVSILESGCDAPARSGISRRAGAGCR